MITVAGIIITILTLACVFLIITVSGMFRKNENLLERLDFYERLESHRKDDPPLHNLYIDKVLILRNCISWNLDESTTPRKLTVKTVDSYLAYYTHGSEFYFKEAEKDTETIEEDHY